VLGVAPDIRHRSARDGEQPSVFYLRPNLNVFTIRCRHDPLAVKRAIEALWPRYFPNETLDVVRMKSFIAAEFYDEDLRLAKLLAASSVIALAIAAFGIYVLAAYTVQRRTKEIVLRKLYGAGNGEIGNLLAREFAALFGAGALLGLPVAWLATQHYLAPFVERAPIGLWTLCAAAAVAAAVTVCATSRHAVAALRITPALVLRD